MTHIKIIKGFSEMHSYFWNHNSSVEEKKAVKKYLDELFSTFDIVIIKKEDTK